MNKSSWREVVGKRKHTSASEVERIETRTGSEVGQRGLSAARRAALLACAILLAGCADLELGPPPDNYVGAEHDTITTETGPVAVLPTAVTQPEQLPSTIPTTEPNVPPATASATQPAEALETQASTQPTTTADTQSATQPNVLSISVADALFIALQNNTSLHVQRLTPTISRTAEEQQVAVFEPVVTGEITGGRTANPAGGTIGSRSNPPGVSFGNTVNATAAVQELFPTGTTVTGSAAATYNSSDSFSDASTRLGVTVSQALLQGAGLDVNLASLRQAQIDTKVSQYELRGFAETLVANVEQAYWNYALAKRQIEIFQNSVDLAQEQLDQTKALIQVGRVSPSEQAAAEAQVALRKEDLINARATLETNRLKLLQLMNPGKQDFWEKQITLKQEPFIPQGVIEGVQAHVNVALVMRPDLNQARLQIKRGDLEIVKTKNGLLPQLNLFITLGKTGYSRSFGGTIPDLSGPDYDALAGVSFSYPPFNTAARAAYRASVLSKEQAVESLENMTQLAQVDVRSAYIDVNRLREQITATAATRAAQEVSLKAETEKFKVGKSNSILVAQAQHDLVQAQIDEVQAVTDFLNSLITLYQLEGTLLERRGIHAPGSKPTPGPTTAGAVGAGATGATSQPAPG